MAGGGQNLSRLLKAATKTTRMYSHHSFAATPLCAGHDWSRLAARRYVYDLWLVTANNVDLNRYTAAFAAVRAKRGLLSAF